MSPLTIDPLDPRALLPAMPRGIEDQHRLARKSPLQIAREFESILVAQVIGAMRKTVSSMGGLFGANGANKILDGAFDQQVATSIAKNAHLGLAEHLAAQMARHTRATENGAPGHALTDARPGAASGIDREPVLGTATVAGADTEPAPTEPANEAALAELVAGAGGHMTSSFGPRHDPITGTMMFHRGVDVAAPAGSAIHAVTGGEVTFSGRRGRAGNVVDVRAGDVVSTYAHVQRTLVRAGQKVAAGDVLATVGSTGRSTGPHVHLAVRRSGQTIDPATILAPVEPAGSGLLLAAADAGEDDSGISAPLQR